MIPELLQVLTVATVIVTATLVYWLLDELHVYQSRKRCPRGQERKQGHDAHYSASDGRWNESVNVVREMLEEMQGGETNDTD